MMGYHAVLVDNDGIVHYIRPSGTKRTEQDMVNYWRRGRFANVWGNSYVHKGKVNFEEGDKIK